MATREKNGTQYNYHLQADSTFVISYTVKEDESAVDISSGYTFEFDVFDPMSKHTTVASYTFGSGIAYPSGGDGTNGIILVTVDCESLWDAETNANQLNYEYAFYVIVSSVKHALAFGELKISRGTVK